MTVQIAAASTALILGHEKRKNGRWTRNSITQNSGLQNHNEKEALRLSGLVLDVLGPAHLREVRDPDKGLGMATDELLKLVDVQGETERRAIVSKDVERVELFARVRSLVRCAVQGDLPASGKVGRPTKEQKKNSNYSLNNASAPGLLSRLKRDHPDLAQQVINGELTATKAARKAGTTTRPIPRNKVERDGLTHSDGAGSQTRKPPKNYAGGISATRTQREALSRPREL